jgi:anti-sigma B factor antagonist
MRAEGLPVASDPLVVADVGFSVQTRRRGAAIVLEYHGELDLAGVDVARLAVARAEACDAQLVVLDMTRLEFIDCSGLETVLAARRRLDARGRAVEIVALPDGAVRRLFTLVGLEDLLRSGEP